MVDRREWALSNRTVSVSRRATTSKLRLLAALVP